jgi:hypothetical protein
MTRTISALIILTLALSSGLAFRQRPGTPTPGPQSRATLEKRLVALFDRNRDGRLDRFEWNRAREILRDLRPDRRHDGDRARHRPGRTRGGREDARPRGGRARFQKPERPAPATRPKAAPGR